MNDRDTRSGFADYLLDAMTLLSMVVVTGGVMALFVWLVPHVVDFLK